MSIQKFMGLISSLFGKKPRLVTVDAWADKEYYTISVDFKDNPDINAIEFKDEFLNMDDAIKKLKQVMNGEDVRQYTKKHKGKVTGLIHKHQVVESLAVVYDNTNVIRVEDKNDNLD